MRKYLTFIFTFCTLLSSGILKASELDAPYPQDEVPAVSAQMELYRKAYEPYYTPEFSQRTTPVPGLIPMVRIGFSYAAGLVDETSEEYSMLYKLWERTSGSFKSDITISQMKAINLEIAYILSKKCSANPSYKEKGLSVCTNLPLSYPLCFEGVLYKRDGELSLTDFIEQGWANPGEASLLLSALPAPVPSCEYDPTCMQGPHGGKYPDPLSFLDHDYRHNGVISTMFMKQPKKLEQFKVFCRRILNAESSPLSQVTLFFTPHETPVPLPFALWEEGAEKDLLRAISKSFKFNARPDELCEFFTARQRISSSLWGALKDDSPLFKKYDVLNTQTLYDEEMPNILLFSSSRENPEIIFAVEFDFITLVEDPRNRIAVVKKTTVLKGSGAVKKSIKALAGHEIIIPHYHAAMAVVFGDEIKLLNHALGGEAKTGLHFPESPRPVAYYKDLLRKALDISKSYSETFYTRFESLFEPKHDDGGGK